VKAFDLIRPRSVEEAVRALPAVSTYAERMRVRPLAGGQDLLCELKDYLIEPEALVDLKQLPGLDGLEHGADGRLEIGALVTLTRLAEDPWIRENLPVLAQGAASVGSPQIRNFGTVGGNLCQRPRCPYYRNEQALCLKKGGNQCHAYGGRSKYAAILGAGPSYIVHPSDLAPPLVTLGAEVTIVGPGGERSLPLDKFFLTPDKGDVTAENVLRGNEIVTRVTVPAGRQHWRSLYLKVRERESFDFALASVAAAVQLEGGKIREARLTLGGVAPRPWRCRSTEQLLLGRELDEETCLRAGEEAVRAAQPLGENAYKLPLTRNLIARALRELSVL
jgi:xanthine dehydrogenase YagS FAD-binding subunit